MKLYRFLTGPDDSSFCHKITEALSKGWQLHGGPTYAYNADSKSMQCGQAVTKDVEGIRYSPDLKLGAQ